MMQQHIDISSVLRQTLACDLYSNLVTRKTGAAVRGQIERLLDVGPTTGHALTVIDFSQVSMIDFSCADEVVAKLLLRYADEEANEVYFLFRGVTDDHWDGWTFPHNPPTAEFPFGLRDEFDRIAKWNAFVKPGSWPDPDMLPLGWLGPHPGKDKERASNYTHDEQRTEFTLWAISRSPLILGTNLTKLDDFTRSLISNKEVLDINQNAVESKPGLTPSPQPGKKPFLQRYWFARTGGPHPKRYIAVFNLADDTTVSTLPWMVFHLNDKPHAAFDIWNQKQIPSAKALHVELPPHGCALFRIE